MALLPWRMRFEGLPKGRLRLQRFPVGQAELKALGSVCLVPNKKLVYCFKSGAGVWWRWHVSVWECPRCKGACKPSLEAGSWVAEFKTRACGIQSLPPLKPYCVASRESLHVSGPQFSHLHCSPGN